MNKLILKEYKKLRRTLTYPAKLAFLEAKAVVHFEALEELELVRIRWESATENYFDINSWDIISAKEGESIDRQIEQEGLWYVAAEYRISKKDDWEYGDSIGMIVGTDEDVCGYGGDLKAQTIRSLRKAMRKEWKECRGRVEFKLQNERIEI